MHPVQSIMFCTALMISNHVRQHVEDLQFAIAFAQMDLESASSKELQRIAQRMDALLNPERPTRWTKPPELDSPALARLQTTALDFLREMLEAGHVQVDLNLRFWAARDLRPGAPPQSRAERDPRAYVSKVGILVYGQLRDWLLYRVIRLFEELGAEKLQMCPAPDCGRLFFKVTRKEFCSTRCQTRIYMRKKRQEEKEEQHASVRRTRHDKTRKE